jgi:RES domain-containing protein
MIAYRIADARHPIFDAGGAKLHGGRWNSPGLAVIYASGTFAGALLEILVHTNFPHPPKHHRAVQINIPEEVEVETVAADQIDGWEDAGMAASRNFGDQWVRSNRTAVLSVPSVITRGREKNVVINPAHSQFPLIICGPPEPVDWDPRLFR